MHSVLFMVGMLHFLQKELSFKKKKTSPDLFLSLPHEQNYFEKEIGGGQPRWPSG